MREYCELLPELVAQTGKGLFLTAGGDTPNPMTISWAQFGLVWNRPMALVLVRKSRYTLSLLEKTDVFTINMPAAGTMVSELSYCGSHSGREGDKFAATGLQRAPAQFGGADGVKGCAARIECRIVQRVDMTMDRLDEEIYKKFYPSTPQFAEGDPHVLHFGEIMGIVRE